MKMIDVFNMLAKDKIKERTILLFDGCQYRYVNNHFEDDSGDWLEDVHEISASFLNLEVELIPPKEKEYLIKLTIKGINDENTYLNRNRERNVIFLSDNFEGQYSQTKFTKQEMQDIQLVRELLEDMEGKYELIEVEE